MKSLAVFPSSREVRLIDTPEPVIAGPTDVKLRILEAGVCGTDREITSFQYGTPPADSPHLVIGHEALGEVVGRRERRHWLGARRPGGADGASSLPSRRLRPVPLRPAGLLHYRRFYGAGNQRGPRIHDRDRR